MIAIAMSAIPVLSILCQSGLEGDPRLVPIAGVHLTFSSSLTWWLLSAWQVLRGRFLVLLGVLQFVPLCTSFLILILYVQTVLRKLSV